MAAILLGGIGSALGAGFGGTFLGLSGAVIGGGIGSLIGTAIDSRIIASLTPDQRQEGARLDELRVTSATEGAVTVAGTALVAKGYFHASDVEPVIGALLTIGSVIWSVRDKRRQ